MLDVARIRTQFPALSHALPDGRPIVHADAPGGTQAHANVIAAMAAYLVSSNANSHGPFPTSQATDGLCDTVRRKAAAFLGGAPAGVVFGANMTTLTWHFSRALRRKVRPGDDIVCTRLDHDANVSPWLALADEFGAQVRWVELSPDGTLDVGTLEAAVTDRTRVVAFPRASNALGTVVDPAPFVRSARAVGALSFCDAVHAAPHVALDDHAGGADVVVCSPYKFFGPHAGILSAAPRLLADLTPDRVRPAPDRGPERWQTGTASFEAIAGVGAALDHLRDVQMSAITQHEHALSERFLAGLAEVPHVRLHGPPTASGRTPTFALTVEGVTPQVVAERMATRGIYVWAGHHYALEPLRALGLLDAGGAVRIGFVHYHGAEDVDRVLDALAGMAGGA